MTDTSDDPAARWPDLLDDVVARVEAFVEDGTTQGLLGDDAPAIAERLWTGARDDEGAVPLEVAVAVAQLYWGRHLAGGSPDGEDREAAVGLFAMIDEVAPDAVPDSVRPLLDELAGASDPREMEIAAAVDLLVAAESGGVPDALDEAVAQFRRLRDSSQGPPDPHRHVVLSNLGVALRLRAERHGELADLDDAVQMTRNALAVDEVPDEPDERAALLGNAAIALGTRFAWTGNQTDLDDAVSLGVRAVDSTGEAAPGWAGRASNLSGLFRVRYDRLGDPDDLDRAVELGRRAAEVPTADASASGLRWSNVSNALAARYDARREPSDLAAAIDAGRRAGDATPATHPTRGPVLANLANLVLERFDRWGGVEDLDEAIDLGEEALAGGRVSGPGLAGLMSNLGNAYRSRYEHRHRDGDLDRALVMSGQSVEHTGATDPQRASRLSNHAMTLLTHYERTSDSEDLRDAIEAGRNAVSAAGPHHIRRSKFLSNLAVLLAARAASTTGPDRVADLDAAVEAGRAAVDALPPADLDLPIRLINLAGSLIDRSRATDECAGDRCEAIGLYRRAAAVAAAPSSVRVQAARSHGAAAASAQDWATALEGYETGVELLGRLATWSITRRSREELLARYALLAGDAAACALSARRLPPAVELLEQGRSVLWAQALDATGPGTRAPSPAVARRLSEIAAALR